MLSVTLEIQSGFTRPHSTVPISSILVFQDSLFRIIMGCLFTQYNKKKFCEFTGNGYRCISNIYVIFAGSVQYCRIFLQKYEQWVYCFSLMLRIKPALQMCLLKIRLIKFKFDCNSIISQPLPNCKSQFSNKEEVGCTKLLH